MWVCDEGNACATTSMSGRDIVHTEVDSVHEERQSGFLRYHVEWDYYALSMQSLHIMLTREIQPVQEFKLKEGHDADWIQCWQPLQPRVRAGDILRTCWMVGNGAVRWVFRHAFHIFGGTTTGATEPSV